MTPTPDELAYIKSRTMEPTFARWSADQRAVYLAVYRGHTRPSAVAAYLGWPAGKTAAVLDGVYGYLLWDKSKPDSAISLRD